jgi:hypothetical protein
MIHQQPRFEGKGGDGGGFHQKTMKNGGKMLNLSEFRLCRGTCLFLYFLILC